MTHRLVVRCGLAGVVGLLLGALAAHLLGLAFANRAGALFRLQETLSLSNAAIQTKYLLPPGTVLNHRYGTDEGYQVYSVLVAIQANAAMQRLGSADKQDAIWAWPIDDREQLQKLLGSYPLTKEDLVMILKARKVTRDELIQIAREWKD